MTARILGLLCAALPLAGLATPAPGATIDAMRDHRRILIVTSPAADDPALRAQRRIMAAWRKGADDRDISVVELNGDAVRGADDTAAVLRRRYALPDGRFAVLLIGKDGHVALRSAKPVPADRLQALIDAMPMRRAGER